MPELGSHVGRSATGLISRYVIPPLTREESKPILVVREQALSLVEGWEILAMATLEQQGLRQQDKDEVGALINKLMEGRDWGSATRIIPAQTAPENLGSLTLTDNMPQAKEDPNKQSVVVVDKEKKQTHVLQMREDGRVATVLTVPDAIGKKASWTPNGRHEVVDKRLDPIWYPPPSIGGAPVSPMRPTKNFPEGNPKNPIGYAFIRTTAGNQLIGLHGTNRPDQIGMNASHGCIRHHNDDILKIYPLVDKGTAVYIVPKFNGTQIKMEDFTKKVKN